MVNLYYFCQSQKDKKSGILSFECSVDAYEKNVSHFWERYESFPSMNDARSSKEHCTFMDQVLELSVILIQGNKPSTHLILLRSLLGEAPVGKSCGPCCLRVQRWKTWLHAESYRYSQPKSPIF